MAPPQASSSDEENFYAAMKLTSSSALPMVLYSAIQLNLLQLIKDAGSAASLSASDLASLIPTSNPHHAASQIDRILRFLSAHSVVNCSLKSLPDGHVHRFYSLSPIGNCLTADEDGVSLASIHTMIQDKVLMDTWYHVKDAVLDGGGIPFNKAHGMNAFEYGAVDPRYNHVFNQGMHHASIMVMNKIVDVYPGFEGIKTLVDVGGGTGASLKIILSKYPTINAINFDLPHVIQDAPPHPGVEHVGGDMFGSVPKGDAIFMKWILHDWSDEHCKKILKNCYEALPEKGKVIIAEGILPSDPSSDMEGFRWAAQADVLMLAYNPGGKERSEEEFQALGESAGFRGFAKVCYARNNWIMEFHK